jgi:hypothetical protein
MVSERLSPGFNTFMMDVTGDLTIGSPLSNSFAGLSLNLPLEISTPVADLRGLRRLMLKQVSLNPYRFKLPQPKKPSLTIK